jgi:hypothetical protein
VGQGTCIAYHVQNPYMLPSPPPLPQAERFMLEMLKLPDVRDRIRSLQYIQTFSSKQKELLEEVSVSGRGRSRGRW